MYSTNRALAVAAGEFLNTKVFQGTADPNTSRVSNKELLADLIQFFIEGDLQNHAAYLVDALIDTNSMIKDWNAMVEMLLSNES